MKILNWNTQADRLRAGTPKFEKVRELIAGYGADVICLTEAYPQAMPGGGQTITSEESGWGRPEDKGARKVVLWSRFGWEDVDTLGSSKMPPGRFIKGTTVVGYERWTIIGICIPYAHYRNHERWGDQRKTFWQGACEYLDALRTDYLPRLIREVFLPYSKTARRTILLGDFNLQIPAYNYPYRRSEVNQKRKATFDSWLIPTAGISRHFIDHIAMSTDLRVNTLQYISEFAPDETRLSDHNGVCIDIVPNT